MANGGIVEADVELNADGSPVFRAFDAIETRMKTIQGQVDSILTRAKAAADAFGGANLKTIQNLQKVIGTLEKFENTVQKYNPDVQAAAAAKKRQEDIEKAYALEGRLAADAVAKRNQIERAYAQRAQVDEEKKTKQLAQMRLQADRDYWNSKESQQKRWEVLGEQQVMRLNKVQLQADAEADKQRLQLQRLREQNQLKLLRDQAQLEVREAQGVRELENIRIASAEKVAQLRAITREGDEEQKRQAFQLLEIEKQRTAAAESRIRAERAAAGRYDNSDARIDRGLDVRAGRLDEKAYARTIESVGIARARQEQIEANIARNIERARILTGEEKIAAENLLKVDEARLSVISARVRQLEAEERRQIAAANRANRPPPTNGGGGGGGLFGNSGLPGVFARTLAYGGAAMAIFGTLNAIRQGLSYAIEYQDAIAKLGAISGATQTQEEALSKSIAEVGKNSRFSTLELVDAATVLAQAGFTEGQIAESLKSVSQLATAAGVSIKEATDVATSAIGAFDLQASELPHINDVLASALNRTKLTIQQVALGIQYAGATAHEQNISFEELTATMAVMAQAGIRSGSTIGTGLRQFLTDLQNPTKKLAAEMKKLGISMQDIDVAHLGLPEVLNRLAAAGFDSAAAYGSLEKRAAAAYVVLRNNRQEIEEQIIAQNQLGQAADAAAKGQDSLAAEWQRFKNNLNDTVQNGVAPARDALRDLLKAMNDDASDEYRRKLLDAMKANYGNAEAVNKLSQELADYDSMVTQLTYVEAAHADEIERGTTAVNRSNEEVTKQKTVLSSVDDAMLRVNARHKELSTNSLALQAETATLTARFEGLAKYLDGATLSFENLTQAMSLYRLEEARTLGSALQSAGIQGRALSASYVRNANSIMQVGIRSGTYGGLPGDLRALMQRLVGNPGDDTLRRQISDRASGLEGAQRKFVDDWVVALDKGVNTFRDASKELFQSDVVGHLTHGKGAILSQEVSNLGGKPRAVIEAEIARLQQAKKGARGESAKAAYDELIRQAQEHLGTGEGPQAPASHTRTRHSNLAARQDSAVDAEILRAASANLKQAIKGLLDMGGGSTFQNGQIIVSGNRTLTADQFQKNLERVNKSLNDWIEARTQQVQDQMKRSQIDPNSVRGKNMLKALNDEIAAKKEEVQRQVGEMIAKALDKVIEAIQDVAKRAEEAADHQMNMAAARVTALGRADLAGKVPDYVQQTYERAAARAKDERDRQLIAINQAELASLIAQRDSFGGMLDAAGNVGMLGKDDPGVQKLKELNFQIVQLQDSTEELKASLGGEGLIPRSFNDSLQMAIENYREVNHLTASWTEMISMNLTDAFSTAQGAMTQFFNDVISGNATMAQSFQSMVKAVIGYLSQLLAKMLAVKLMEIALNLFGAPSSAATNAFDTTGANALVAAHNSDVLSGLGFAPHLYGGEVHALSGRYITEGVPNRDSVRAKIARGEFVVRKSAVDSVGVDFMKDLNERGAMALKALQPKIVLPPPAQQLMNVYVIPPDQQPQMSPNDVIIALADDIYRGGQSKQLIKQVAQGG